MPSLTVYFITTLLISLLEWKTHLAHCQNDEHYMKSWTRSFLYIPSYESLITMNSIKKNFDKRLFHISDFQLIFTFSFLTREPYALAIFTIRLGSNFNIPSSYNALFWTPLHHFTLWIPPLLLSNDYQSPYKAILSFFCLDYRTSPRYDRDRYNAFLKQLTSSFNYVRLSYCRF